MGFSTSAARSRPYHLEEFQVPRRPLGRFCFDGRIRRTGVQAVADHRAIKAAQGGDAPVPEAEVLEDHPNDLARSKTPRASGDWT